MDQEGLATPQGVTELRHTFAAFQVVFMSQKKSSSGFVFFLAKCGIKNSSCAPFSGRGRNLIQICCGIFFLMWILCK